ncbi:MAG TPA: hypothetical protein VFB42_07410 [Gaiellaceae bacterium]|nr:hypothetical protein [Gaiellaceae bacterium]
MRKALTTTIAAAALVTVGVPAAGARVGRTLPIEASGVKAAGAVKVVQAGHRAARPASCDAPAPALSAPLPEPAGYNDWAGT